jgi:hypothetical protein
LQIKPFVYLENNRIILDDILTNLSDAGIVGIDI